jgi:hypothetical protein
MEREMLMPQVYWSEWALKMPERDLRGFPEEVTFHLDLERHIVCQVQPEGQCSR